MKPVLLIDFGSTYTKITAVDVDAEQILGTAQSYTTIETDIINGLNNALAILREKIGNIEFQEQYACSSAAGGLRMVAIGLVPELTAKAARQASLGAGAKVLKTYSYELTEKDLQEIDQINPADRRYRRRQQGKYRLQCAHAGKSQEQLPDHHCGQPQLFRSV